jgi:hypothetical protein
LAAAMYFVAPSSTANRTPPSAIFYHNIRLFYCGGFVEIECE